ncbi:hypothetical protein LX36DRAFT_656340, partial [Colletotrichum falcatum]
MTTHVAGGTAWCRLDCYSPAVLMLAARFFIALATKTTHYLPFFPGRRLSPFCSSRYAGRKKQTRSVKTINADLADTAHELAWGNGCPL